MVFKPRPKATRPQRRSTDALLVRTVLTSPGVLPSSQPEGSPFRWTEIVSGAMKLNESRATTLPYLKQRLVRGLRQLKGAGEVEQVGWGVYRLKPQSPSALELLSALSTRVECLTRALAAPPTAVPPWLAENEWYYLRDRFKDVALALERELVRAGQTLELPTTVRVLEAADEQPANRRLEVRFRARMIESADSTLKAIAENASDSRLPGGPPGPVQVARVTMGPPSEGGAPGSGKAATESGRAGRRASRSTRRRTPSRRRAASGPLRRGRPARAASRPT